MKLLQSFGIKGGLIILGGAYKPQWCHVIAELNHMVKNWNECSFVDSIF